MIKDETVIFAFLAGMMFGRSWNKPGKGKPVVSSTYKPKLPTKPGIKTRPMLKPPVSFSPYQIVK